MYEVADDTYCYPGTSVLKNKLNIKDQKKLDAFETEMTDLRSLEPVPSGSLNDIHYKAIHRHLFQDVYDWAGKLRSVRISKGGSPFCYPDHIDAQMKKLFKQLSKDKYLRGLDEAVFSKRAAHFLAELNAIHPFREGNGRTQLSYLSLLADRAGHPLNLKKLKPGKVMEAMIESFDGSEQSLAELIEGLIE